ncbi:carboxy-terminal domain RNA polymerase II [Tripterygium wilfordii]|uniref:Mitochondrial import inner membrane translocase subunit TIM50 n=1 Tax=Tripterygium wilfordii TaxID=458696 RepID=A0A7J7CT24_TRIWF|nr:carboxy-terminal domain RNA polymerase II [Tripterygium wilfordii]
MVEQGEECEGKPKINLVTVFERPGLLEFLKQIGEFSDLVMFTAGLEGYAKQLVDRIDMDNQFKLLLYRPSTVSTSGTSNAICTNRMQHGVFCITSGRPLSRK